MKQIDVGKICGSKSEHQWSLATVWMSGCADASLSRVWALENPKRQLTLLRKMTRRTAQNTCIGHWHLRWIKSFLCTHCFCKWKILFSKWKYSSKLFYDSQINIRIERWKEWFCTEIFPTLSVFDNYGSFYSFSWHFEEYLAIKIWPAYLFLDIHTS